MSLQRILDQLTVSPEMRQIAYRDQLNQAERTFDALVADREKETVTNVGGPNYVYRAINLGEYLVRGSMIGVAAQPTQHIHARGSDITRRTIQLWSPKAGPGTTESLYLSNSDFLGEYTIQSARKQAAVTAMAELVYFRDLLDEIVAFA